VEVVPIAYSCHDPKQASSPEESRPYVTGIWDAAEVEAVYTNRDENSGCEEERGHDGSRIGVVRPVCSIEAVGPRARRFLLVIVVLLGRPGWPSHCVEVEEVVKSKCLATLFRDLG
jgi:hypothetical protein